MLPRRSQEFLRLHAAVPDVSTSGFDITHRQEVKRGLPAPPPRWDLIPLNSGGFGRLLLGQRLLFVDLMGQPRWESTADGN